MILPTLFGKSMQRSTMIVSVVAAMIFLLTQCINREHEAKSKKTLVDREQFAGSEACANCHKAIYIHHLQTAHHLTSGIASATSIKGNFEPGKNVFAFDQRMKVAMEKRDSSFYQVEYDQGIEKNARRFDIVVGSGTMGQSFLYWKNNVLFQLPITYFSAAKEWSNSPGFPEKAVFNRVITSRCLECHTTFASTVSAPGKEPEQFEPNNMIYGISCEKCHGPGKAHIAFQSQHPEDSIGKFIVDPRKLSRQQNLDLCALCHGGRLKKTNPSFSFVAGERLSDFFEVDTSAPDPDHIDVHGNQYGLLRASKCFRMSNTLTCNTCHDPHQQEKGLTELFSKRCMNCHSNEHGNFCKMGKVIGSSITSNCIDCHMPVKPSKTIAVFLPGDNKATAALIRSHYISIYPEETKKMMKVLVSRKAAK